MKWTDQIRAALAKSIAARDTFAVGSLPREMMDRAIADMERDLRDWEAQESK